MDDTVVVTQFENLNQRLARVEQFLPTLATRDEMHAAISAAVAPLATKEELLRTKEQLHLAIETAIERAVAPLATKEELRAEGERSRRHMDVLMEAQRGDIQLLAEHLSVVMSRLANG